MRCSWIERGGAAPFGDLGIGKAKPAVGVLSAQKFEPMRREIDQHKTAVRPQHARRLGDDRCRPVGVVQHLMDHDRVERRVGKRQLIHVAEPHLGVLEPGPFEIGPRHCQHLARQVNAEPPFDPGRQNFEHAAGTGADVEQIAWIGAVDYIDECGFDLAFVDVELADAMPARCVLAKIGNRQIGAQALDRAQPL